jgi:hypothetical protein
VVECGGLENRFRGFSSDEGSNPSPSVFRDIWLVSREHGVPDWLKGTGLARQRTSITPLLADSFARRSPERRLKASDTASMDRNFALVSGQPHRHTVLGPERRPTTVRDGCFGAATNRIVKPRLLKQKRGRRSH